MPGGYDSAVKIYSMVEVGVINSRVRCHDDASQRSVKRGNTGTLNEKWSHLLAAGTALGASHRDDNNTLYFCGRYAAGL